MKHVRGIFLVNFVKHELKTVLKNRSGNSDRPQTVIDTASKRKLIVYIYKLLKVKLMSSLQGRNSRIRRNQDSPVSTLRNKDEYRTNFYLSCPAVDLRCTER
jgi:hypothetical protein